MNLYELALFIKPETVHNLSPLQQCIAHTDHKVSLLFLEATYK